MLGRGGGCLGRNVASGVLVVPLGTHGLGLISSVAGVASVPGLLSGFHAHQGTRRGYNR